MPNNTEELCPDVSKEYLRGRTTDTGIEIIDTMNLVIANMTFWASNLIATNKISEITLDSLIFKYPSSSHRMLKSEELPKHTRVGFSKLNFNSIISIKI